MTGLIPWDAAAVAGSSIIFAAMGPIDVSCVVGSLPQPASNQKLSRVSTMYLMVISFLLSFLRYRKT
jgi:hypothetical protein